MAKIIIMENPKPTTRYKVITTIAVVIAVLALLLCFHQCTERREDNLQSDRNEAAYRDTVRNIKNDLGGITATKLAFERSNSDLQKELNRQKKNGTELQKEMAILTKKFNKLVAIGTIEAEVNIPEIDIPFSEPIPCEFEPKLDSVKNDWYAATVYVNKSGVRIIDLNVPTSEHIVFGYKGNGLFKKDQAVMEVTFGNPHINVTEATGTVVAIDTPWYKKWYLWLAAGVAATLGVQLAL